MNHVYWLLDGLLAGRPGPRLFPWDLDQLRVGGLRAIVSLGGGANARKIEAVGLRHYALPLTGIPPVTGLQQRLVLRDLEKVLDAIHAEVSAGQPVLVHCVAGKDRTGLALSAYLVRYHGLAIEEALARVRAVQPIAMTAPGYEAVARRFAEREGNLARDA